MQIREEFKNPSHGIRPLGGYPNIIKGSFDFSIYPGKSLVWHHRNMFGKHWEISFSVLQQPHFAIFKVRKEPHVTIPLQLDLNWCAHQIWMIFLLKTLNSLSRTRVRAVWSSLNICWDFSNPLIGPRQPANNDDDDDDLWW